MQAGMTGFNPTYLATDHQMLWVDFTLNSLFGYRPPLLAPIVQTGVALKDPEQIHLLNARFHKARQRHNIPNQIFWLEQRAPNNLFDQDDALLFETLLELDDKLREKCKKKIRKKYASQVLYSDIIGKDRKELHLWSLTLNRLQNRSVDTRKIRQLMLSTDQPTALQLDLPAVQRAQKLCKQRYKQHKLEDAKLRQDFQLRVNKRRAIKFGTSVETQEKITKSAFKTKNTFSRIRKVIKKIPELPSSTLRRQMHSTSPSNALNGQKSTKHASLKAKKDTHNPTPLPFLTRPSSKASAFLATKIM
jgi:hypothetical protein